LYLEITREKRWSIIEPNEDLARLVCAVSALQAAKFFAPLCLEKAAAFVELGWGCGRASGGAGE
jgi:hypothetical protein